MGQLSAGNLVNNGDLVAIDTAIDGPVVNNNAVTVVGTVDFNGPVSGSGGFFGPGTAHFNGGLAPGNSPASIPFAGNLAFGPSAALEIEIGGLVPGTSHDQINVGGTATLKGTLALSLINGFVPSAGDRFTIMTFGSRVSTFPTVTGTTISPTLAFHPLYSATELTLIANNPTEKTWGVDAGGPASVATNWLGGVAPSGVNDALAFTTAITANRTVQIDAPLSLRLLRFDDNNNYTIAGSNTITLNATSGDAQISVTGGSHTISARSRSPTTPSLPFRPRPAISRSPGRSAPAP